MPLYHRQLYHCIRHWLALPGSSTIMVHGTKHIQQIVDWITESHYLNVLKNTLLAIWLNSVANPRASTLKTFWHSDSPTLMYSWCTRFDAKAQFQCNRFCGIRPVIITLASSRMDHHLRLEEKNINRPSRIHVFLPTFTLFLFRYRLKRESSCRLAPTK